MKVVARTYCRLLRAAALGFLAVAVVRGDAFWIGVGVASFAVELLYRRSDRRGDIPGRPASERQATRAEHRQASRVPWWERQRLTKRIDPCVGHTRPSDDAHGRGRCEAIG